MTARLRARGLTVGYGTRTVVDGIDLDVPDGGFTVIVGPNGCGKSTLLKALSRTARITAGEVLLDGRPIGSYRGKETARRLGMLPQSPLAPDTITVRDLVARGRYPHTSLLRPWSREDDRAVTEALAETGTAELADTLVVDLSGGQRQRVWLALVLAQQTDIVLLDEPTTFLDIGHQYEVLDLCERLRTAGRTFVAVLHDLGQAARYATRLVVMDRGGVVAQGDSTTLLNSALIEEVFGLRCRVLRDETDGSPLIVPERVSREPVQKA